ncbi:hypothetical protein [Sphingomonas vulcanisoli]|uniref:hypothetical protein n=1 Tax=Sphingomonas vulcanisoli TaxID=1658060 RepID=UPI001FB8DC85|nr:hypothetical protein [Sphingomonas vulcanisoli]
MLGFCHADDGVQRAGDLDRIVVLGRRDDDPIDEPAHFARACGVVDFPAAQRLRQAGDLLPVRVDDLRVERDHRRRLQLA